MNKRDASATEEKDKEVYFFNVYKWPRLGVQVWKILNPFQQWNAKILLKAEVYLF